MAEFSWIIHQATIRKIYKAINKSGCFILKQPDSRIYEKGS